MIVDDDPAHAEAIIKALKGSGTVWETQVAGSLGEYREAVAFAAPDIVLMDLNLPDGRAVDILTTPLEDGPFPILIMAGNGDEKTAVEAMKSGALDYIVKSPEAFAETPRILVRALREWSLLEKAKRRDEELRQSEERYRTITENMTDTVWVMDLDFKTTYISPSVLKTRGYTFDELSAMPLEKHFTPASLEVVARIIAEEMTPERLADKDITISRSMEIEFYRKDGSTFWGDIVMTLVRDAQGRPKEILGVGRDITERKLYGEALIKAAQEWRTTFDSITDLISIQDADYRITRVNRAFADFLKTNPKDLIGKYCYELIHGTKEPPPFCPHKRAFETKQSVEKEIFEPRLGMDFHLVDSPIMDAKGDVVGTVHVIKNITDRKRTEEALKKSEEKYRDIFDRAVVGISQTTPKGRFLAVNPAFTRILGYDSAEELMGAITDIGKQSYVDPRKRDEVKTILARDGEIHNFEIELYRKDRSTVWVSIDATAVYDEKGAIHHYQGTMLDITERKRAEEALRESNIRFKKLSSNVPGMIYQFLKRPDGTYCVPFTTESIKDIFGCLPQDVLEDFSPIARVIVPEDLDKVVGSIESSAESMVVWQCEYRVQVPGRPVRWLFGQSTPEKLADGSIIWHGFNTDITERKRAEEALRESETRWRMLVKTIPDFVALHDRDARYVFLNHYAEGFSEKEVIGKSLYDFISDDSEETYRRMFAACLDTGATQHFEFTGLGDRGVMRTYENYLVPLIENGQTVNILAIAEDITERKRAEEALRESEEKHRTILHTIEDGYFEVDLEGSFTAFNGSMRGMLGYDQEEMVGTNYRQYMGKETAKKVFLTFNEVFRTGIPAKTADWRLTRKDGTIIDIETSISLKRDSSGAPMGFFGIARDITERERMEAALKMSEERFKQVAESAGEWIWEVDAEGQYTYASPVIEKMLGYKAEEIVGKKYFYDFFYPEDGESCKAAALAAFAAKQPFREFINRNVHKNGQTIWLSTSGSPLLDDNGNLIGYRGANTDITERKRAEEKLRESEERYRSLVENVNDVVFHVDISGNITYISPVVEAISGYGPDEYIKKKFAKFIHPEDLPHLISRFEQAAQGIKGESEFRVITRDGSYRNVHSSSKRIVEAGSVVGLMGVLSDITERKRAEEALRRSEEKFRLMIENSHDIIYTLTTDGVFTFVSPAWTTLLGHAVNQVVGQPFQPFVHPDDRAKCMVFLKTVIDTGKRQGGVEYRVRHVDGSWRWHTSSAVALRDESGTIIGYQGIARDITESKLAEEAVRESEEKYRSLVENINDVVFNIDLNGTITYISPVAETITGYSIDEYKEKNLAEFIHPEDLSKAISGFERSLKGIKGETEFRAITKDGSYRYMRSSSNPIFEAGSVVGLTGVITDITEHRLAEEALQKEQRDILLILNSSPIVIFYTDKEGKYIRVNKAFAMGLGRTEEEILGKTVFDLFPPEVAQSMTDSDQEVMKSGRPKLNITECYESTGGIAGGIRWLQADKIPIYDANNSVIGLAGFAQDITERRQAEEELKESEERYRELVENIEDIVYVTDGTGKVIFLNNAFARISGYTREEMLRKNYMEILTPESRREVLELFKKQKKGRHLGVFEMSFFDKDRVVKTIEVREKHIFKGDRVVEVHGLGRDITEKKKMELQLLQSEKLSAVGTMISGVAHELNNPLTSIIGNAQLLAKRDVPGDIKTKLNVILKESIRSSKIVAGLLSFAREHKPERKVISINDIVTESLKLREYDLRVSNIDFRVSLSEDLPETFADPYHLQQVFINLINNARDALAERSGAALAIRTYRDNDLIFIDFEDNGPGIEKETLSKIFDPFFTTKEVGKGTGLGLSVAYGIINEHGGTISVESQPGSGAKFIVALPITKGAQPSGEKTKAPVKAPPGARTILVVEDEASLRELLVDALTEGGFFVEAASTGEEAIQLVEKRKFDAVISDIKMPGIGGKELYLYIQKHHPEIAEKIVFITGDVLSRDTQSFLQITNNRFIEKPFNIDALVALLNDMLSE
jgi:PAS domain S-box-containing protein